MLKVTYYVQLKWYQRESPECDSGVLIYPFSCENSLELQYSLIKLLVEKNEFNVYPASLIDYGKEIKVGKQSTFKVMGSAISNKGIRLDIVDGDSNYLIGSELVNNDLKSIFSGICEILGLMNQSIKS